MSDMDKPNIAKMQQLTCGCGGTFWIIADGGTFCAACDTSIPKGYKFIRGHHNRRFRLIPHNRI